MARSRYTPVFLSLETRKGSRFQAEAWVQAGEVRISLDGFTDQTLVLEPQSVRKACEQILQLLDRQPKVHKEK